MASTEAASFQIADFLRGERRARICAAKAEERLMNLVVAVVDE